MYLLTLDTSSNQLSKTPVIYFLSVKLSISIFSHINFPKINDKCRWSLNNKPRVLEHLLPTSLEFRMKFKWQALYDSKRHCSTLV